MHDEIRTDRLLLRPLCTSDAESMFAYRGDPEAARFQSWEPQSLEDVRSFIAGQRAPNPDEPGWYQTAIVERRTGILLGDIGIHILESDPRQVELGFTLAPDAQHRGHATEAVRAVLHHLFVQLDKHRVFASTDPRNLRAIALLHRLGLRQEAHCLESLWFKGKWADDLIFAILRREWSVVRAD
jgi:RimJ/RimL family protein N-acetyltransferase